MSSLTSILTTLGTFSIYKNGDGKSYYDYTLEELNNMSVLERASLMNWTVEIITISTILVFALAFKLGDLYNKRLVTQFLKSTSDVFQKNFAQFGVGRDQLYIKDSPEDYTSYATGRLNIANVLIKFKLIPRNNPFLWIIEFVLSNFTESVKTPADVVEIVINVSREAHYENFIAAVVSKLGMNDQRKENYYLSLTRTVESDLIPQSYILMCETNELGTKILTNKLKSSLTVENASFLKFIAVTDQQSEKPSSIREYAPNRKVIIKLSVPSNKKQLSEVNEMISGVLSLVDKLVSKEITISNDSLKKVVKTREAELEKAKKIALEAKEESAAAEKAKAAREEKERLKNLPESERVKLEKKALEKKQRKLQKKQQQRLKV